VIDCVEAFFARRVIHAGEVDEGDELEFRVVAQDRNDLDDGSGLDADRELAIGDLLVKHARAEQRRNTRGDRPKPEHLGPGCFRLDFVTGSSNLAQDPLSS
jgi:hypothetical protein